MSKLHQALPLPTRDGVGPSCVSLPEGPWATIAECFAHRFAAIDATVWEARMAAGEVVDEHGLAVTPTTPHRPHLRVYYYRDHRVIADEPRVPFDEVVLFSDAHIVIVDKPHFLPVTPSGDHLHETLLVHLKRRLGIDTLVPVHRIDRETAGLVMLSIDPATRGIYHRLFAERTVRKVYECIAPWRADLVLPHMRCTRLVDDPGHFMRVCETPGSPNAETRIECVERRGVVARYRLVPLTGRKHQLRVHCAALGLPIFGDRIYPTLMPAGTDDHTQPLQLLAQSLEFSDPVSGVARRFESGLQLRPLDDHWAAHQ